jgi:DNA-directed RNA polymerase subunit omega
MRERSVAQIIMIEPSLEELLDKVDSKFSLITMVSKRARQLNSGFPKLVKTISKKNVTIALEEIAQSKIIMTKKKAKEG